jgi:hypothetical protein
VKGNCAYGSVDGNDLSRQQLVGDVAGADHGGDSVLARYQGGMCGQAAAVYYHSGGAGEQRTLAITASLSASPAASSLSSTPSQSGKAYPRRRQTGRCNPGGPDADR